MRSAGSGVEVGALMRFSDAYKNQQMWRAASDQGARAQTQPYLTQLERIMGDDGSSISKGIDGFFTALNAAAVDPTSTPLRQQIITSADAMAQNFNSITNVMSNQLLSLNQQRAAIVPQANTALQNIASLNQRISTSTAAGTNVSAMIDARDQLIDGLASQMAIEVNNQPDGSTQHFPEKRPAAGDRLDGRRTGGRHERRRRAGPEPEICQLQIYAR